MSLSLRAVEQLFARLSVTYGRDFLSKFEGLDPSAVKSSWANELAEFANDPSSISWALKHLPDRPPNVVGFRAIARRAPAPEMPRVEVSRADAERIAAELAKLAKLRPTIKAARPTPFNGKDWARRIVENHRQGYGSRSPLPLKMAKAALADRSNTSPGAAA